MTSSPSTVSSASVAQDASSAFTKQTNALKSTSTAPKATPSNTNNNTNNNLPWYRAGGMKVNMVGMGINIVSPIIILSQNLSPTNLKSFITVLLFSYAASLIHRKTLYCIVVVPTFMASLLLSNSLDDIQAQIALSIALVIAICKVNICMSVCLHRYAAHSAFKCGYMTNIVLCTLGCLANQGGPIWWASQHRCHHKYCDVDRDPHSPVLDGSELAFSFFENPKHENVEEEFVPVHLNGDRESFGMRVMDTWSWLVVFCELCLSYIWFGRDGLFICYTSGWLCQTITLWFNVVNHPPDRKKDDNVNHTTNSSSSSSSSNGEKNKNQTKSGMTDACRASDGKDTIFDDFYIPFMFLDFLVPIFSFFVNESEHGHHHTHAKLAKRSRFDVAYWGFVWPLEQLGLVWDVVV